MGTQLDTTDRGFPSWVAVDRRRSSSCCFVQVNAAAWMHGCAGGQGVLGEVGHGLPSSMQQKLALQTRNVIGFVGAREPFQITLSFHPYDIIPRSPQSGQPAGPRPPGVASATDLPHPQSTIHNPHNATATPIRSQNKQTPPEHGYAPPSGSRLSASPPRLQQPPLFPSTDICMYIHTHTYDTRREVNKSNFFSSLAVQLGVPRAALRPWF